MVRYAEAYSIEKKIKGYYLFLCLIGFSILFGYSFGGATAIPNYVDDQESNLAVLPESCEIAQSGAPHPNDCLVCHDVQGGYLPGLLVAPNSTELCGMCHISEYNSFKGTTHDEAGVVCSDCHGYALRQDGSPFLNHSFAYDSSSNPCGQSDFCHAEMFGHDSYQVEVIRDTYGALVEDILNELTRLQDLLDEYNANSDANATLVNDIQNIIDECQDVIQTYDQSSAFHNWQTVNSELVATHNDLVKARATLVEATPKPPVVVYITETVTVTVTDTGETLSSQSIMTALLFMELAILGFLVSLVFGVIIGKYRFR